MAELEWKREYNVHVRRIDRQHRTILDVLNELTSAVDAGKGREVVGDVLERLCRYIREHFDTEEQYMLQYSYPGYERQKREHDRFVDRVVEFQRDFMKNRTVVTINLFNFIWDWFSLHILKLDKEYEPFFRACRLR